MSDTETCSLTFAAWEGATGVEWEAEVTVKRDGDRQVWSLASAAGTGAVDGTAITALQLFWEKLAVGIARSKGVVVELPLEWPHR